MATVALLTEGTKHAVNAQMAAADFPNDHDAGCLRTQQICTTVSKYVKTVYVVTFDDLPEHGDVSDFLPNHTPGELFARMQAAPKWTAPAGTKVTEIGKLSSMGIGPELICLADVKALPVPWLWRPFLAYSILTMLSGDPSSGKTFIALAIAADLSNGRVPVSGEVCEPVDTLYLSHENAAEYVIRPRFDAQGGDPRVSTKDGRQDAEN